MCGRLQEIGVAVTFDAVLEEAAGGAVGRPHVARAVVRAGAAENVNEAFDRYLGRNKPAYADKVLPTFSAVADLVHAAGAWSRRQLAGPCSAAGARPLEA